jgi:hypothetical protein
MTKKLNTKASSRKGKSVPGNKVADGVPEAEGKPKKPAGSKPKGGTRPSAKKQVKAAREAVYERLPEIVKGLASKSGGNYLTAKFLFDFAKVEEVSGKAKHPGKPESVAGLLEKLGFADESDGGEQVNIGGSEASKGKE